MKKSKSGKGVPTDILKLRLSESQRIILYIFSMTLTAKEYDDSLIESSARRRKSVSFIFTGPYFQHLLKRNFIKKNLPGFIKFKLASHLTIQSSSPFFYEKNFKSKSLTIWETHFVSPVVCTNF